MLRSKFLAFVFSGVLAAVVGYDTNLITSEVFPHHAVLVQNTYEAFWKYDDEYMTFEIHCATTGYVGFGLSPNGGMPGSDIVIGGVSADGTNYFTDRHASSESEPIMDAQQDWELLSASQTDTKTVLKFKRKLDTCDSNDMVITSGTTRLIWAYGTSDSVQYHGTKRRGTKSVQLKAVQLDTPIIPNDIIKWDFLMNNTAIPSKRDTTYMCKAFRVPKLNGIKHHAIKYEPVIQVGNEATVHHIIVYGCYDQVNDSFHGQSHNCDYMPREWAGCNAALFAWAIGAGEQYYPNHAGFLFGDADQPTFFRMEVHYDNPSFVPGMTDSSGIRVTLTPTLRQYDAGLLTMGQLVTRFQAIPPGAESFTSYGYCYGQCLSQALVNHTAGIKIVSSFLHSHLLGKSLRLRHIRNGVELPVIDRDETYDFNFQESRMLPNEVTLLPGDDMILECDYDSTVRSNMTWGGASTKEEMCLAFLTYYPKMPLTACYSIPQPGVQFQVFDDPELRYEYNERHYNYYVTSPASLKNKTLQQALDSLTWDQEKIDKFEDLQKTATQLPLCGIVEKYQYDLPDMGPVNVTSPLVPPQRNCQDDGNDDISPSAASEMISCALVIVTMLFVV